MAWYKITEDCFVRTGISMHDEGTDFSPSCTDPPRSFRSGLVPWRSFLLIMVSLISIWNAFRASSGFLSWYKRSELGIRVAVFFSAASVAGAFSASFSSLSIPSSDQSCRWFTGGRNWKHEWCRWTTWMGLDIYSWRTGNDIVCNGLVLDDRRLSRYCEVSYQIRK